MIISTDDTHLKETSRVPVLKKHKAVFNREGINVPKYLMCPKGDKVTLSTRVVVGRPPIFIELFDDVTPLEPNLYRWDPPESIDKYVRGTDLVVPLEEMTSLYGEDEKIKNEYGHTSLQHLNVLDLIAIVTQKATSTKPWLNQLILSMYDKPS